MASIHINGITLGIEQRGEQGQPPLVLLHGFTGSAASWGAYLDTFAAHGMRVIALDMLGHGQSDAPQQAQRYSIEHCCADILAVVQALGIAPHEAVLLGYSMGGRIALYTALSGYFRALILESASAGIEQAQEREQRRQNDERLAERIEREGVPAFVAYWEQLPLFASQQALANEVRNTVHVQRLHNRAIGLANSLRGVGTGTQPALYDQLPTFQLPVLLLAGELDQKFVATAQRMAQLLPQAELHIIEGSGHTIHLEQPAQFERHVLDFCKSTT